ncbi:MAG: response regulator [Deltaproteobacteria bacterium]|nr:response regulator [Deltaproteobacteria bacterium]
MAKTVLVVDDITFVRKTLIEILQKSHLQVVGEAEDGEKAVELYRKLQPDIVTMDIVMPEMSGIEAARKILKIDKNAKIVMISALGQENLVMEAINAGVKDYILKPFSEEEILKTIEKALTSDERLTGRASQRTQKSL